MSAAFQNDIIKFLDDEVRAIIKQELHEAQYYTTLADETKDISTAEQLSVAFRYVCKSGIVERFTGYVHAKSLKIYLNTSSQRWPHLILAMTKWLVNAMTELL